MTTQYKNLALVSCIISLVLSAVVGLYRTGLPMQNNVFYDVIYCAAQITYIIALVYVIELLKFAGESKAISLAFYIFTGALVITSTIGFASFPPNIMEVLLYTVNGIVLLSTICVIIASFFVKNPLIANSFRIFAAIQILMVALIFGITPVLAHINPAAYFSISRYFHFGGLITIAAINYIISSSGNLISANKS